MRDTYLNNLIEDVLESERLWADRADVLIDAVTPRQLSEATQEYLQIIDAIKGVNCSFEQTHGTQSILILHIEQSISELNDPENARN